MEKWVNETLNYSKESELLHYLEEARFHTRPFPNCLKV